MCNFGRQRLPCLHVTSVIKSPGYNVRAKHNSACHPYQKTFTKQNDENKSERTDCAAPQSNLLGLGDGGHLPLGPLIDPLVDGVDESQEGALLLKLVTTLIAEGMIGTAAGWCGQNGEGPDRRRPYRTGQEGLLC